MPISKPPKHLCTVSKLQDPTFKFTMKIKELGSKDGIATAMVDFEMHGKNDADHLAIAADLILKAAVELSDDGELDARLMAAIQALDLLT